MYNNNNNNDNNNKNLHSRGKREFKSSYERLKVPPHAYAKINKI